MKHELDEYGADIHGVREMIVYGLKGMSTYARHARLLGEWDDEIGAFTLEVHSQPKGVPIDCHCSRSWQKINLFAYIGESESFSS